MNYAVATLAESPTATTCSAIVARRSHFQIIPSASFEEAVTFVKAGVAKAALVPGAYPDIGKFFNDPKLRLERTFTATIPAIVLAAMPKGRSPFRRVFAHPATRVFWTQLDAPVIPAASNDAAAAAVISKRLACITNAAAARSRGLKILHVFREESPMSWSLFVRTGGRASVRRSVLRTDLKLKHPPRL